MTIKSKSERDEKRAGLLDRENPERESTFFQRLLGIGKRLIAEPEIGLVLATGIDAAIELSGAERGLIILFDEGGQTLFETARKLKKEEIAHPEFEVSHTIINKVRSEGAPACYRNAMEDPTLGKSDSTARLKILSVICLPLIYEGKVFGVVYLDNRNVRGVFQPETCTFMQEFVDFISLAAYRALERKQLHNRVQALEGELRGKYRFEAIVGHHPKMVAILKLVSQIADTSATVLIQGESGTGKELIASALHYNSSRRDKPFIPVNCAAVPESLLESELFGHVRGAFTGAFKDKEGWFERADGGTIFLDEVNEMAPALQVKLLRILQTGEYSRLGSTEIRYCDVRVVAAAGRDLLQLVKEGKFRAEVYYRLNVIDIWLPPLRERKSDIPLLVQHFMKIYGTQYGKGCLRLSREAEGTLLSYDFPGNIRELENIIQRAVVTAEGQVIESLELLSGRAAVTVTSPTARISSFKLDKQRAVEAFERQYIIECLKATEGNISLAAQMAAMNFKNFHAKMRKYGIDPHVFKVTSE